MLVLALSPISAIKSQADDRQMAVPKKKVSTSKRNMRRSHDALAPRRVVVCSNCGVEKLPHHICHACGYYGAEQVIRR